MDRFVRKFGYSNLKYNGNIGKLEAFASRATYLRNLVKWNI